MKMFSIPLSEGFSSTSSDIHDLSVASIDCYEREYTTCFLKRIYSQKTEDYCFMGMVSQRIEFFHIENDHIWLRRAFRRRMSKRLFICLSSLSS